MQRRHRREPIIRSLRERATHQLHEWSGSVGTQRLDEGEAPLRDVSQRVLRRLAAEGRGSCEREVEKGSQGEHVARDGRRTAFGLLGARCCIGAPKRLPGPR